MMLCALIVGSWIGIIVGLGLWSFGVVTGTGALLIYLGSALLAALFSMPLRVLPAPSTTKKPQHFPL